MKKYIKPAFVMVNLGNNSLMAGSNVDIDNNPIQGEDVGAKESLFVIEDYATE